MKRLGFGIVIIALLGSAISFFFLSGASLPYQDATPEMLLAQAQQIRRWNMALVTSLILFIIGVGLVWLFRKKD